MTQNTTFLNHSEMSLLSFQIKTKLVELRLEASLVNFFLKFQYNSALSLCEDRADLSVVCRMLIQHQGNQWCNHDMKQDWWLAGFLNFLTWAIPRPLKTLPLSELELLQRSGSAYIHSIPF